MDVNVVSERKMPKGRQAKRLTFDEFMREQVMRIVLDIIFSDDPGFVVEMRDNRVPVVVKEYGLARLYYSKIRQCLAHIYDKQRNWSRYEKLFVDACERSGLAEHCYLGASRVITTCDPDRLYLTGAELFNEMMVQLRTDLTNAELPSFC